VSFLAQKSQKTIGWGLGQDSASGFTAGFHGSVRQGRGVRIGGETWHPD